MTPVKQKETWHLDKRVPLVLIFTIVAQTFYITWVASQAAEKIEQTISRVTIIEATLDAERRERIANTTAIAVIAENLRHMSLTMGRIEEAVKSQNGGD